MKHKYKNIVGKYINYFYVLNCTKYNRHIYYFCRCRCGIMFFVRRDHLISNNTKSCGCYRSERMINQNYRHGMVFTEIHRIWCGMLNRCYNKNSKDYKNYGGRGIKVCNKWRAKNGVGLTNFYNDMGDKPCGKSLDRKNNNGDYTPDNCRWISNSEQQLNKRNTLYITLNSTKKPLKIWCKELGLNYSTAWDKIRRRNIDPYMALGVKEKK